MSVTFSKGKYYVGDLCYVIRDEAWQELLERTDYFANNEFEFNDETGFSANTAYGDGIYSDEDGREYFVDAGLIGIIPVKALGSIEDAVGGQIIEFEEDFDVYVRDGIFFFGDVVIITRDDDIEFY